MQLWPQKATPPEVLAGVLNSTWSLLAKSVFMRGLGLEGNVQLDVYAAKMMLIPDTGGGISSVLDRVALAFAKVSNRRSGQMVESELMSCHSPERARELALRPLELPEELRQPDRRELDDAVFEMLGVSDPARRNNLVDRLYEEVTRHFRQIRLVEIQKMEQRSPPTRGGPSRSGSRSGPGTSPRSRCRKAPRASPPRRTTWTA
jgi:hypothetical protein